MSGSWKVVPGAVLFLLLIASCTPGSSSTPPVTSTLGHGSVVRLQLVPIPEGPSGPIFQRDAESGDRYIQPLDRVSKYMPVPLPLPLQQPRDCEFGGNLVVTFSDEFELTYGPCSRPDSINRLWAAMEFAFDGGQCVPVCGPNGVNAPQVDQA